MRSIKWSHADSLPLNLRSDGHDRDRLVYAPDGPVELFSHWCSEPHPLRDQCLRRLSWAHGLVGRSLRLLGPYLHGEHWPEVKAGLEMESRGVDECTSTWSVYVWIVKNPWRLGIIEPQALTEESS